MCQTIASETRIVTSFRKTGTISTTKRYSLVNILDFNTQSIDQHVQSNVAGLLLEFSDLGSKALPASGPHTSGASLQQRWPIRETSPLSTNKLKPLYRWTRKQDTIFNRIFSYNLWHQLFFLFFLHFSKCLTLAQMTFSDSAKGA